MSQYRSAGVADQRSADQDPDSAPAGTTPRSSTRTDIDQSAVEHLQLIPLRPRRQNPWLLVEVDGTAAGHRALLWALREAARREATVVAVSVLDGPDGDPLEGTARLTKRTQDAARDHLEAQVLRAVAETGISGRTRTAFLERAVFEALDAAMHGADLVMVGADGKRLLRPAVPRQPLRRLARGA
ncbi:universal stress protein [Blastococcus sp. TML/M2B]|uniref:universal stress protein n=1 Tax=unclassified Blastococcus TaxID=2619396 RepID=UPI00190BAD28|nr:MULTISPECIES: universal stress protein [unclassified Blastococcus]MBN1094223.1 universal stress protein [Blastococcus sp. TML/M2B]MBN1095656.1 universal stress protein [Blastococcus sp. TML/C7B]